MNITLVNPSYFDVYGKYTEAKDLISGSPPPLGLLYIAAVLRQQGHQVSVVDAEVEKLSIDETFRRGITVEEVKRAFKLTKEVGMKTLAYFIIGHPYETIESIKRTIKLAKMLKPDVVQFSIMTPFPGTQLAEMVKQGEGNMKIITRDWNLYSHYGGAVINVSGLSENDLSRWQKRAFISVYTQPAYFLKILKTFRPKQLLSIIKLGLKR